FPIFGRGRALCSLEGKALAAKDIEEAARFLCGACSCQVKELNPGVDLLIAADWDELIEAEPGPVPLTRVAVEPTPSIPPGETAEEPAPDEPAARDCHCRLWLWGGGAAAALVLLGTWVLRGRVSRTGPSPPSRR